MTSLYNELYAHGWFGLAQVKQEAMHEHHRKKRQTNKGKRVRERRGWGGGGVQEIKKVLTSSGSTPKSLQSFSTPSGPMVSGSSWPLSN